MQVLPVILYTLVVVVALMLIGLVLIQQSKGGGFGGAFSGLGESVFGAHAGSHLTKATVILTTIFFVVSLLLAAILGHRGEQESVAASKPAAVESKTAMGEKAPIVPKAVDSAAVKDEKNKK